MLVLIALAAAVVILLVVLARVYIRRLDPPPVAHCESGSSHLRESG